MIGVITYISVLERTKEIGILKSIGARKKDISRVFNAETVIIGFSAGAIGIIVSLLIRINVDAVWSFQIQDAKQFQVVGIGRAGDGRRHILVIPVCKNSLTGGCGNLTVKDGSYFG